MCWAHNGSLRLFGLKRAHFVSRALWGSKVSLRLNIFLCKNRFWKIVGLKSALWSLLGFKGAQWAQRALETQIRLRKVVQKSSLKCCATKVWGSKGLFRAQRCSMGSRILNILLCKRSNLVASKELLVFRKAHCDSKDLWAQINQQKLEPLFLSLGKQILEMSWAQKRSLKLTGAQKSSWG